MFFANPRCQILRLTSSISKTSILKTICLPIWKTFNLWRHKICAHSLNLLFYNTFKSPTTSWFNEKIKLQNFTCKNLSFWLLLSSFHKKNFWVQRFGNVGVNRGKFISFPSLDSFCAKNNDFILALSINFIFIHSMENTR